MRQKRVGQNIGSGPTLMDKKALEDIWRDGRCPHTTSNAGLYGRCVTLACTECDLMMLFFLRFGWQKTMDVFVRDGSDRPVGRATMEGSRDFILENAVNIFMPEGGADPAGGLVERDRMMLDVLMGELCPTPADPPDNPGDFAGAWAGLDCNHATVSCQVYGRRITMECRDCATQIMFDHIGPDKFDVYVSRMPLEPVAYGAHGAGEVVGVLRKYAGSISLPNRMADKMSDDPERDAGRLLGLVEVLVGNGLLRRVELPDRPDRRVLGMVNITACDRSEFTQRKGAMVEALRDGVEGVGGGMHAGGEFALEGFRVVWPWWFDGVGVDVGSYQVDGMSEFCIRCGFSTLDDGSVGPDGWRRGCPECGYVGYMLGMDAGRAGAAAGVEP